MMLGKVARRLHGSRATKLGVVIAFATFVTGYTMGRAFPWFVLPATVPACTTSMGFDGADACGISHCLELFDLGCISLESTTHFDDIGQPDVLLLLQKFKLELCYRCTKNNVTIVGVYEARGRVRVQSNWFTFQNNGINTRMRSKAGVIWDGLLSYTSKSGIVCFGFIYNNVTSPFPN